MSTSAGRRTVEHSVRNRYLHGNNSANILRETRLEVSVRTMDVKNLGKILRLATVICIAAVAALCAIPATKNMAVIVSAGSKLSDIQLADLTKMCRGGQKTWPDGRSFLLVIKDPESPEMRVTVLKLFGEASNGAKSAIVKVNESRPIIKIVSNDEELLHIVGATPGAAGILDVYSINSSVKVLRVDGKLPFDVGYALRGN